SAARAREDSALRAGPAAPAGPLVLARRLRRLPAVGTRGRRGVAPISHLPKPSGSAHLDQALPPDPRATAQYQPRFDPSPIHRDLARIEHGTLERRNDRRGTSLEVPSGHPQGAIRSRRAVGGTSGHHASRLAPRHRLLAASPPGRGRTGKGLTMLVLIAGSDLDYCARIGES